MQEKLGSLAAQLDAIIRRIRTLGLTRAADDLLTVSTELRRLEHAGPSRATDDGASKPGAGSGQAP